MNTAYQLQGLRYSYGKNEILSGIDATFELGKTAALVGPNGAGKTTLLKLLAFLELPNEGQILFHGETVAQAQRLAARRRVGLVQQNPYLLQGSILANVAVGLQVRGIGKSARTERAMDILTQFGLAHKARHSARDLSGGEAQKVALARILILEPEVLLFDEPFTHLDTIVAAEIETLITNIRENQAQTIIFSTHDQLRAQTLADSVHSLIRGILVPTSLVNLYTGTLIAANRFDTKQDRDPASRRCGDRLTCRHSAKAYRAITRTTALDHAQRLPGTCYRAFGRRRPGTRHDRRR